MTDELKTWKEAMGFVEGRFKLPSGGYIASHWTEVVVVDTDGDIANLPIPYTREAIRAQLKLFGVTLPPDPPSFLDVFDSGKPVAVLRKQPNGRWRVLHRVSEWYAWSTLFNHECTSYLRSDLPTTGTIVILTDPDELAKYPLE